MRSIIQSDLKNTLNTIRRLLEFATDNERETVAAEMAYAVAKGVSNELNMQTGLLSQTHLRLLKEKDNERKEAR